MRHGLVLVIAWLAAGQALAGEAPSIDVRASSTTWLARQALLPGSAGVLVQPKGVAMLYGSAFLRVRGLDTPLGEGGLSAEFSAWGALGALPGWLGETADGDLQAAWVQQAGRFWRVRLGRQVTLPGAARYVRYDGAAGGVQWGAFVVDAWAGQVTKPRFIGARGYYALGSVADALRDSTFIESQARDGEWLVGARVGWRGPRWLRGALAFHEQRGDAGLSFRNVAADARGSSGEVDYGGRLVFDLSALRPAEARLYADVLVLDTLPLSFDYGYANTALLLPASSVLAAFGGGAWHELGAEATWRASQFFRLTGRAAGQLYEGGEPGLRSSVRAQWTPDVDERWLLIGEYARTSAASNGYHHLRAAARWRAARDVGVSADVGAWLYDVDVRGVRSSVTGVASVDWLVVPRLKALFSASLSRSPFAAMEAQALGRLVFELDGPSAGGDS